MKLRKPLSYQIPAIHYCIKEQHPALFIEMRLGKCLCTIRAIEHFRNPDKGERALIVAPLTVLDSWAEELQLEGLSYVWLKSAMSDEDIEKSLNNIMLEDFSGYYLINYELLLSRPWLATNDPARGFDYVVIDESVTIKNPKVNITKLLISGFRRAKKRFVLSGLPTPEDSLDFCCQYLFLRGEFMGFRNYWSARKALYNNCGYDWVPKRGTMARVKEWTHAHGYFLTRKQAGVGSSKVYKKRYIEQNAKQIALTSRVMNEWESSDLSTKYAVVVDSWLSRIAGGFSPEGELINPAKAKELVNLLSGEFKGEPVVVFFKFNKELFTVHRMLKEAGIDHRFITGKTKPENRAIRRRKFQNGRFPVILCQIKCVKWGLNFARSSTIIYYSNSSSMNERGQSEDRIINALKKEPVLYIDLVTRDSKDEVLVEALRDKKADSTFFMTELLKKWALKFKCRKKGLRK